MFPLSDQFEGAALSATYFALCAVFSVLAFWRFRFAIVPPLILVALYLKWFLSRDPAFDPYGILIVLFFFIVATGFAAAWGSLIAIVQPKLRRDKSRLPNVALQCAIALIPSILFVGLKFERQIVWPSPCSQERLVISLGAARFYIHPEMRAYLKRGWNPKSSLPLLQVRYSTDLDKKTDLRMLCDAAEGGDKAVAMDAIVFNTSRTYERMVAICSGPEAATRHYCQAGLPTWLAESASVEIINRAVLRLPTQLSWLEKDDSARLMTGGDEHEGFICQGEDTSIFDRRCYAWREIGPDITLFVDTWDRTEATKQEHLDRAQNVLDWVPGAFMQ